MDRHTDETLDDEAAIQRSNYEDPETWDMSEEDWSRGWHGNPMDILMHLKSLVIRDEDIAAHFAAHHRDWRRAINEALRKQIGAA